MKKGRFLFVADLHLTDRLADEYRWSIFHWLRKEALNREVAGIFILGDLTDKKDHHSAELTNRLVTCLGSLAREFNVSILKGNHDYVTVPFFKFLSRLGVSYYSEIGVQTILCDDRKHWQFLMLPHGTKEGQWIAQTYRDKDFVLLHEVITGAKVRGITLEGRSGSHFINPDGPIFIAGDIHIPQRVGSVIYCGAPHPVNFGDDFLPRVLYWNGEKLKSIYRHTIKKATLEGSPGQIQKQMDALENRDQAKLVVTLPRERFSEWDTIKKKLLRRAEKLGVVIRGVELNEKRKKELKLSVPVSRTEKDVFLQYCDEKELDDDLRTVGEEIVDAV
jgi:UDP-2,3-diacylglucosamine pyrophosphatase LpxH